MIPLLAPLLGSLAGSLLPATLGTGIAGALGLKGATAGLVAAAAPKAIGAGIGTLLAGGDLGDAALNAVGFGAGSALFGGRAGSIAGGAAPVAAPPAPAMTVPTAPAANIAGGGALPGQVGQPTGRAAAENPMMASLFQQPSASPLAGPAPSPTVPSVVPASGGIGSLPGMNNNMMMAGMSPDQSGMVNQYLRSQNMVGFA
jgi:type IV secretion system protein TrbL